MSDVHDCVSKSAGGNGAPAVPERLVYSEAPIDGTFTNPVVAGFHPDPSICRVGPDYYLACSSLSLRASVPSSGGVYAPTLRHHDDRFWLITTDVSGEGTVLFTAMDPVGPWSDPIRLLALTVIDPDLAWDSDGRCWCTYAGIGQVRIDPGTGQLATAFRSPAGPRRTGRSRRARPTPF
jgi:xylan 1,4-beta-xylosidase